jgi:hypothetical protein
MDSVDRQAQWENVYETRGENEVSWFQECPTISLDLIDATGVKPGASIIDIGAGASRLIDALLDKGLTRYPFLTFPTRHWRLRRPVSVRERRKCDGSSLT